jgi:hypothetical protein
VLTYLAGVLTHMQGKAGKGEEDKADKDYQAIDKYRTSTSFRSESGHEEYGVCGGYDTASLWRRGMIRFPQISGY